MAPIADANTARSIWRWTEGTGDIVAVDVTSSREGDSLVLPDLLEQIPPDQEIGTVTGDGAFDTRRCHTPILERGGTAIIPI